MNTSIVKTPQMGSSRSRERQNRELPQPQNALPSATTKTPLSSLTLKQQCSSALNALEGARSKQHATQKLFQALKTIQSLSIALNRLPATAERARQTESVQSLIEYGQSLRSIVDNAQITSKKPRPMDAFESTVLIHMIFDLVHPDKSIAQSAHANLISLGLTVEKVELLQVKLLEEMKSKPGVQFSAQSLQSLIQDSLESIRQNNSVFEVMDKVANHYIQTAESTIPLILFGAAGSDYDYGLYDATQPPAWSTWKADTDTINRFNAFEWNQHVIDRKFQLAELERRTFQQNLSSMQETNAGLTQAISQAISDGIAQGIAQGQAFSQFKRN